MYFSKAGQSGSPGGGPAFGSAPKTTVRLDAIPVSCPDQNGLDAVRPRMWGMYTARALMMGIARVSSRNPTCTWVAQVCSLRAGHWICSTSSAYRWLGAIFASRQSLTACVPEAASTIPCGAAVCCKSLMDRARSALASLTVPQIPVTTSIVDCISSYRICGCSPFSARPGRPASTIPASCRSIRVCASISWTSHSTPSVVPFDAFHSMVGMMTSS